MATALRELVTNVAFKVLGKNEALNAAKAVEASVSKIGTAARSVGDRLRAIGNGFRSLSTSAQAGFSGILERARAARDALRGAGAAGQKAGEDVHAGAEHGASGLHLLRHAALEAFSVLGLIYGVHQLTELADEWASLSATIKNTTDSAQEFLKVRQQLFQIAQGAGIDTEGPVSLFNQLSMNRKETGLDNQQIVGITNTIARGIALGHGTADQNRRAIRQFDDMLSQGKLSERHLQALQVDSPMLAGLLAQAAGGKDKLNALAKGGKGGTKEIVDLINKMAPIVDKDFGNVQMTFGMAASHIRNDLRKLIGEFLVDNKLISSILQTITSAVDWLTESIEKAATALGGYNQLLNLAAILIAAAFGRQVIGLIVSVTRAVAGLAVATDAAFLPWLLLAAAIASALLAMEDIYSWVEGKKSVIGALIGPYSDFKEQITSIGQALRDAFGLKNFSFKDALDDLSKIRDILLGLDTSKRWQFAGDAHNALSDFKEIIDVVGRIYNFTTKPIDWLVDGAQKFGEYWRHGPQGEMPDGTDTTKVNRDWRQYNSGVSPYDRVLPQWPTERPILPYTPPAFPYTFGEGGTTTTNNPIINVYADGQNPTSVAKATETGVKRALPPTPTRAKTASAFPISEAGASQ